VTEVKIEFDDVIELDISGEDRLELTVSNINGTSKKTGWLNKTQTNNLINHLLEILSDVRKDS
jgi:hypothetical protein